MSSKGLCIENRTPGSYSIVGCMLAALQIYIQRLRNGLQSQQFQQVYRDAKLSEEASAQLYQLPSIASSSPSEESFLQE